MARGTALAKVLYMLKGQLGYVMRPGVGPGQDDNLLTIIEDRQNWLASEFDWPFLIHRQDIVAPIQTRYISFPTGFNEDRPITAQSLYNTYWHDLDYGITAADYNALQSGDGGTPIRYQDPVFKWQRKFDDPTQVELWPIPITAQTIRFQGQRTLTSLRNNSIGGYAFDWTAALDLDDSLIVLWSAAQYLMRANKPDAKSVLTLAEERLAKMRANFPSHDPSFPLTNQESYIKPYRYRLPRVIHS
jgi:hypothetical protein